MKKVLAGVLIVLLVFVIPAAMGANETSAGEILDGIDVSRWQGSVDFNRVKQSGVKAVYIRSSVGLNYTDPYYIEHYNGARKAGLDIGFYHSCTAKTKTEAREQARFYITVISSAQPQLRLAVEFSRLGTKAQTNEVALAFLREAKRLSGKEMVLYTNASNARTLWNKEVADEALLWVAEYGVDEPKDIGSWDSWAGFQYSNTGRVPGVSGDVDLDKFTKGIYLSGEDSIPEPEPSPNGHLVQIVIKRGDTLYKIARKFNTTVTELAKLNHIDSPDRIYAGQTLLVPVERDGDEGVKYVEYKVKRGDTLHRIADEWNKGVNEIALFNHIKNPNLIYAGEVIRIPIAEERIFFYTIRRGDTLDRIARRFNMPLDKLAAINKIRNVNLIYAGMKLEIHTNE